MSTKFKVTHSQWLNLHLHKLVSEYILKFCTPDLDCLTLVLALVLFCLVLFQSSQGCVKSFGITSLKNMVNNA